MSALSLVSGPTSEPLWTTTLGALVETQARYYGNRTAVVFPSQNVALTYNDLYARSTLVAKALVESGLKYGDRIGISAGNCVEYIEVFLGAARIGCPVVVLNSTYTPAELLRAVTFTDCRMLCAAHFSSSSSNLSEHFELLNKSLKRPIQLVLINGDFESHTKQLPTTAYGDFIARGQTSRIADFKMASMESYVRASDIVNLQFTSGTTGHPKASMLTHTNLINNARQLGSSRLRLSKEDVICCPPPLFHCFGLVMGFLGAFTHGCSIVFPSPAFNANSVLDAIEAHGCTVLYGVPTMFIATLDANIIRRRNLSSLNKALAAGSLVPQAIVNRLQVEAGIDAVLIAYGMTETSPVTFCTSMDDSPKYQLTSVGTVLPHSSAKIIDSHGNTVARGVRGEICTSGYALQKGYLDNVEKTNEVMKLDDNGVLWMHTGDEGVIDEAGYCRVTGRIKDMIIRGGENIIPAEIEERLLAHAAIAEASVVGLPDDRYGESVACFLRAAETESIHQRPSAVDVADWVRQVLGRHKAPKHVFWIGDPRVGSDFPKTGSGKHQKNILRAIGAKLLDTNRPRPRL